MLDPLEWPLRRQLDLVKRAYELRKARRIGIVHVDQGNVSISESDWDPHCECVQAGTRRPLTWPAFERLIVAAEAVAEMPLRKTAAREAETVLQFERTGTNL